MFTTPKGLEFWTLIFIAGCGFNNPFKAPEPPKPTQVKMIYPPEGDTVGPGMIILAWEPVRKREAYHLQVSNRANTWVRPYCIIDTMVLDPNYLYLFKDTLEYYWKIRVQTLTYHEWSIWSDIWSFVVNKINHPPDTPSIPSPVNEAMEVSIKLTLEWVSGDPDGDTVIYFIYFGKDSVFSAGDTIVDGRGIRPAHLAYELDTLEHNTKYFWKVDAQDTRNATSPGTIWKFTTGDTSSPPNPPAPPIGPGEDYIDETCVFTTQTTDPDGDSVRYKVDFGDGFQSNWTQFVPSGEPGSVSHTYNKVGFFYVKAKAQDIHFNESEWSDSTGITIKVGPGACWVADVNGNKVVKLGRGGSKICQFDNQGVPPWHHDNFKQPLTLRVDPNDGCCWVACTYNQGKFKIAPNCSLLVVAPFPPQGVYEAPSTPCIDKNNDCWFTFAEQKKLVKYERYTMNKLDSIIDNLGEYLFPIAIELDVDSNWIWVVEKSYFAPGYVSKFDAISHNRIFKISGFNGLWAEVDPFTHYCWIADEANNLVRKISPDGNVQSFGGFNGPLCVSVDPNNHNVWVSDKGNNQVVKLSEVGNEIFRSQPGLFNNPTAVEVDPNDGSCWVSDAGNSRVVKISAEGNWLFEVPGFVTPMGLSANPNPDP